MSDIEGGCLCGGVRFAITPPTLFFAHCHCRWCREAHGAAFVSWVGVAEERMRILPGSVQASWYQEVHVARSAIRGPLDRGPQCHIFHDQRVDWVELGDSLPRYDTDDLALAKFRVAPR